MEESFERKVKEHLRRVCGLGMDDVEELYGLGRQTILDTRERLDGAFSRGDSAEAADAGHMLKGALLNMGLEEQGATAKSLELAAKAGRLDEAGALYEALRPLLARF